MPGIESILRVVFLAAGCAVIFWIILIVIRRIELSADVRQVVMVIYYVMAGIVAINLVLILMGLHYYRP